MKTQDDLRRLYQVLVALTVVLVLYGVFKARGILAPPEVTLPALLVPPAPLEGCVPFDTVPAGDGYVVELRRCRIR